MSDVLLVSVHGVAYQSAMVALAAPKKTGGRVIAMMENHSRTSLATAIEGLYDDLWTGCGEGFRVWYSCPR